MADDHYEGFGFYFLALDYWKSAMHINDAREQGELKLRFPHTVPYYLYVHSIELALKAYLRTKGVSKKELSRKKYGHNLETLLAECVRRAMSVAKHETIVVEWLNTFVDDQAFRYLRPGFQSLPADIDVRRACKALLDRAKSACEQAGIDPEPSMG
jgi:hypothetical protein